MDYAKDDGHSLREPTARVHAANDAVDDADNVRVLHPLFRKRTGRLLDHFQCHWHSDTGVYHRLGTSGNSSISGTKTRVRLDRDSRDPA